VVDVLPAGYYVPVGDGDGFEGGQDLPVPGGSGDGAGCERICGGSVEGNPVGYHYGTAHLGGGHLNALSVRLV